MAEPEEKPEFPKKGNQGEEKPIKDKISNRFEELKKDKNLQKVYNFTKTNTKDTIAYIAIFIGILLLFFQPFWGGVIIGAVGGFYFADTIIHWLRNFKDYLEEEGTVKAVIVLGVALGFLIGATSFFLGAAAAVGIKFILFGESKTK
jgi:hypothetical protein